MLGVEEHLEAAGSNCFSLSGGGEGGGRQRCGVEGKLPNALGSYVAAVLVVALVLVVIVVLVALVIVVLAVLVLAVLVVLVVLILVVLVVLALVVLVLVVFVVLVLLLGLDEGAGFEAESTF